ncbi:mannose-1-phosphate guanylyltransferase/mannose-6-phosphate isomerase (plasmid) [Shimia sp. W99]
MTIHPVILCGGAGTRLWPLSRKSYPKQFSQITGKQSLFQAAVERLTGDAFADPIILTNNDFRFIVTEQMAAINQSAAAILIEPDGRNTAPAILAAALWLERTDPDALMLVAPSDHVIPDCDAFRSAVTAAESSALDGNFVTFGITPTGPETGYGYLELDPADRTTTAAPWPLVRFVEKPAAERAVEMLASGNYLWNAGIFLLPVRALLTAYRTHAAPMLDSVTQALAESQKDLDFTRLAPEPWVMIEPISIDYAIMEKEDGLSVMPYSGAWSDLGSWDAVWRQMEQSDDGNACSEHAMAIDCRDTLLRSETPGQELVGIGLEDIVAIAMPDAVLVTRKSDSQKTGEAVAALRALNASQATMFPRDHRPWGWFESLAVGDRFQVKRIVVKPSGILSLQSHHHRAEHWIVVAGTAKVTLGEEERLLSENQSIYVPLGTVHRLENPGKVPMVLIEVQTGTYLGEDDIIRYEDIYARN